MKQNQYALLNLSEISRYLIDIISVKTVKQCYERIVVAVYQILTITKLLMPFFLLIRQTNSSKNIKCTCTPFVAAKCFH